MDQVVVVGQDERTALLDLQAVLVARYLPLTGPLGSGEILSTQPGLIGRLRERETGPVRSVTNARHVYKLRNK